MMEVKLPFSGFYDSVHDQLLDDCLYDDQVNFPDVDNWNEVHPAYARMYAGEFFHYIKHNYDLDLKYTFGELSSPREYNFETDKIFVEVENIQDLVNHVGNNCLDRFKALVKERCTSYDGFISYYPNDLAEWGHYSEWKAPQFGICLEAVFETFDIDTELVIMDGAIGNGGITECLEAGVSNE